MPSNVFSYFRPGHSKRNASSSSLASPDAQIADFLAPSPALQQNEAIPSPRIPDHTPASPVSPLPPQLPPIPRVASRLDRRGHPPAVSSTRRPDESSQNAGPPAVHMRPPSEPAPAQTLPSMGGVRPPLRPATSAETAEGDVHGQGGGLNIELNTEQSRTMTPPVASSSFLSPSSISANYSTHSKSQSSLLGSWTEKLSSSTPKMLDTPTAPPRGGKSRLSLRSPLSLFSRRRSGEALTSLADESLVSRRSPPTARRVGDDADPSIRGRIVHDFSAPRPNRNFSHSASYGSERDAADTGRISPQKVDRQHTPVFREHFDDDTSYEQSQAAIRAESLANNDFIKRNSWQPPPPQHSSPPPPALPKDSPPAPPQSVTAPPEASVEFESSLLSPVLEAPSPVEGTPERTPEQTPRKQKSAKNLPSTRSRATSMSDATFVPAGLPTHQTSKASRFSFQISGNDSTQEKLLEERHKQKEAEKASKQKHTSTNTMDDEYDGYDMDDYDMDDGLEEDIPMLGGDDDDGFGNQSLTAGLNAFDFSTLSISANNAMPLTPIGMNGQIETPRDVDGNVIGFAMTGNAIPQTQLYHTNHDGQVWEVTNPGKSLDSSIGYAETERIVENSDENRVPDNTRGAGIDLDDDLYFDDGMIDEQGELNGLGFDESVFDDPSGPLFERKAKPPPVEERLTALHSNPPEQASSDAGDLEEEDGVSPLMQTGAPSLMHKTSMAHQRPIQDLNNLEVYHSALAEAALKAEAEGRFVRKASVISDQSFGPDDTSSRPSLIPDNSRTSQETTGFPPEDDIFGMGSGFIDDYEYSHYDSALEDDPMIAAANAELLANDYDGIYGQEFGFYANAQGESWNAYGGFFGPSGLGRSKSGRNAVQEPNLTPITERSEYSTRNSFVSVNHFRDGQQPLQSPGLAQLARMSPYDWSEDDPDMSLEQLMKLRKGAFGGSAVSLGSGGTSPRNSSPMGMSYVPRNASPMANYPVIQSGWPGTVDSDDSPAQESRFAVQYDYESDGVDQDALDAVNASPDDNLSNTEASRPESPTLTASDYNTLSSPPTRADLPPFPISSPPHNAPKLPPQPLTISTDFQAYQFPHIIDTSLSSPISSRSVASANVSAPRMASQSLGLVTPILQASPTSPGGAYRDGHGRKASTADSIHYMQEQDEMGGNRWVLERRRTAESGELELVGREIVEGGRI